MKRNLIKRGIASWMILITLFGACAEQKKQSVSEIKTTPGQAKVEKEISTEESNKIENGTQILKYKNGNKKAEGNYMDGKREGKWTAWFENGNIWSECEYKEGIKNGRSSVYYENGQKMYEGNYDMDKRTGLWKVWDEKGNLVKEEKY